MQYAVIALPRQGKTYSMTWLSHKWAREGLNTYVNYTVKTPKDAKEGAAIRPWAVFEDMMFFKKSKFIRDEAHVHYSSYRWKPSELEQAAIAMHAKNGNDVYYISQVGSYLAKFLREICETFIFVKRLGPDGRQVINADVETIEEQEKLMRKGIVLPGGFSLFRNHPIGFKLSYFYRDQLNDENLPRKGSRAYNVDMVPFSLEVARSYRSDEIVVPQHLLAWKARLERTAPMRADLPAVTGDFLPTLDPEMLGLTNLTPEEQQASMALLMQIYGGLNTSSISIKVA